MILLLKLIFAHLLTDFVLQPTSWVVSRNSKHFKSKELYFHGIITALVAWIFIGGWENWIAILALFCSHTLIDLWKSYREQNTRYFLVDQALHILTIILIVEVIQPIGLIYLLEEQLNSTENIIFIIGWILAVFPTGYYISLITKKWQNEFEEKGLVNAGMLIGWTERTLIYLMVITGSLTAVGFILTAKSIFRYVDLKDSNDKKKTEYILIGTLLSFAFALVIGLAAKYYLQ